MSGDHFESGFIERSPEPILDPVNNNPISRVPAKRISTAYGEVSGEMVWARSEELGQIAGRTVNNEDYGQALRELTGGNGMDARMQIYANEEKPS